MEFAWWYKLLELFRSKMYNVFFVLDMLSVS